MNLQITGKNFDLTEAIKAHAEDKIGGVVRMAENIIDIRVTLEHVRTDHTDAYHASAHVHVSHDDLHCEMVHNDVYAAIDGLKDEVERQLRDRKSKYGAQHRKAQQTQREMKSVFSVKDTEE